MKAIYETYDPLTGKHKNQYSTGGYASAQFGWSSAFLMEMILERYQEKRFVFDDTQKIEGFIREAEVFSTRETFYRVQAGTELPKVVIQSGDGKPLLQAKTIKVKLSEPYNYYRTVPYKVWIKGKPFELQSYKQHTIEL